MKYLDFEELIEDKNLKVEDEGNYVVVRDMDGWEVVAVSKNVTKSLNTNFPGFSCLSNKLRDYVVQRCIELAFTELKDREGGEEEKYYYRLKGFLNENYLKIDSQCNTPFVANKNNSNMFKTQFTDKEFEELPEDIKAHNWEKIKVECED